MNALRVGHLERTKATVHGTIAVGMGVSALYNAAAFVERDDPEWHLFFGAVLYTAIGVYEAKRAQQHWQARDRG